jgi:starch synthase
MQVVQSVCGKFHHFHLARQLHRRELLTAIFSSYPRVKLRGEQLPPELIRTFPYVHLAALAGMRYQEKYPEAVQQLARWDRASFDAHVARHLPECDVFVGISGTGLRTGTLAQSRGAAYVCDRGSAHIRYQDQILREEFRRWGQEFDGIDPHTIAQEEAEYAAADLITVPSLFAKQSFIRMGVPEAKLHLVPYGVDLSCFSQVALPDPKYFDVLFVGAGSLQKGIPYLLDSFARLHHPGKRLTLAGQIMPEVKTIIEQYSARLPITCLGHVPQPKLKDIMSRSHVFVLPSVQDGFGMVMAQAMACGCPVIASEHTGARDLYQDGEEGFIVPIRDSEALAGCLQRLVDDPALQKQMSQASLKRVHSLGGWDCYGDTMVAVLQSLKSRDPS